MAQNPVVTFTMENGDIIKAELYPEIAPISVNNFISRVFDTSFSPLYIVTTVFKPFEAYFFVKFYVFICTCLYLCVIIDTRGDLLCM